MVVPGQQRHARRAAQRRGVKAVVLQPAIRQLLSVGMLIGPPNALLVPEADVVDEHDHDVGDPAGAFTSNRGGAFASRASSVVIVSGCGSWIGSTVRSRLSAAQGGAGDRDASARRRGYEPYDFHVGSSSL